MVVVGRCWIRGSLEQVYYLRCEWFTPKGLEGEWFTPKIGKVSLQQARNTKAKSTKKVRKSYFRTFVLFFCFYIFPFKLKGNV